MWNADGSGTPVMLAGHTGSVWSAAFSPDGRRVVTASEDGTARVWNADASGTPVVLAGHRGSVVSAAFRPRRPPGGHRLGDSTAWVWHADGSGPPVVLAGHTGSVGARPSAPTAAGWLPLPEDSTARVVECRRVGHPGGAGRAQGLVWSAAFSPDGLPGGHRLGGPHGPGVECRRLRHPRGAGRAHGQRCVSAAFSPDGRRVVTASGDGTARVWDADRSGTPVVLAGHTDVAERGSAPTAAGWSPPRRRTDGSSVAGELGRPGRIPPIGHLRVPDSGAARAPAGRGGAGRTCQIQRVRTRTRSSMKGSGGVAGQDWWMGSRKLPTCTPFQTPARTTRLPPLVAGTPVLGYDRGTAR